MSEDSSNYGGFCQSRLGRGPPPTLRPSEKAAQPLGQGRKAAAVGVTRRGQQAIDFTDSGYGLSYTNPTIDVSFRERLMAHSKLVNLTSALTDGYNLQTSNNPGIGGGTCFGDSGGPIFYGDAQSNLIVGVTSFGLSQWVCAGVDFAYRVDQADVIAWILNTVPKNQAARIQFAAP